MNRQREPRWRPRAASATLVLSASLGLVAADGPADAQREPPDRTIGAEERGRVIDGVLKALNVRYVFPETAAKMESAIRERVRKGEYDRMTSGNTLAETLTTHLQEVSRDKHLHKEVYVLTSKRTFSGAEEFTCDGSTAAKAAWLLRTFTEAVPPHGHYWLHPQQTLNPFYVGRGLGRQPDTVFLSRCGPCPSTGAVVLSTARRQTVLYRTEGLLPSTAAIQNGKWYRAVSTAAKAARF